MTPRQENSIERSVGRIEAQLEAVAAFIVKADGRMDATEEWQRDMTARFEKMEASDVSKAFNALQQSIHDGKMQAKGVVIGVGVAAGAGGATIATFAKSAWAWLMGGGV